MSLRIGDIAPDFSAETTKGRIDFHDWMEDQWCILFSHPKDFTPVCTTELADAASLEKKFEDKNCKLIGLSVDSVKDHLAWITDIKIATGRQVRFPLIADSDLRVAKRYNMLPASAGDSSAGRTAMDNYTVRSVFFIAPDKTLRALMTYPMTTGREFGEVLRLLDSLQLTAQHKVATPAGWFSDGEVLIPPTVSNEEAETLYPDGWRSTLPYMRYVKAAALGKRS